ncbi:MAG: hypothetical protein WC783_03925 [Candidatus Paceibacterota bacterium]|jgi:hypothetical protein
MSYTTQLTREDVIKIAQETLHRAEKERLESSEDSIVFKYNELVDFTAELLRIVELMMKSTYCAGNCIDMNQIYTILKSKCNE